MSLMKITPYGDSLLRKRSLSIERIDDDLERLVGDMIDTMHIAKGVGLAAPQVGVSKQLFLMDWSEIEEGGEMDAYINPKIIEADGKIVTQQDGCLSLPDIWADVARANHILVQYMDRSGDQIEEVMFDLAARVFQHEYDHLIGILFIDRIPAKARSKLKDALQAILDGRVKTFDPMDASVSA
ncbi:MAG: peptide deformylase [Candidatus Electryoneaceae bacterium]|nr:peptide deformylase [Candidatus Electryoneaceae bacterium]